MTCIAVLFFKFVIATVPEGLWFSSVQAHRTGTLSDSVKAEGEHDKQFSAPMPIALSCGFDFVEASSSGSDDKDS